MYKTESTGTSETNLMQQKRIKEIPTFLGGKIERLNRSRLTPNNEEETAIIAPFFEDKRGIQKPFFEKNIVEKVGIGQGGPKLNTVFLKFNGFKEAAEKREKINSLKQNFEAFKNA